MGLGAWTGGVAAKTTAAAGLTGGGGNGTAFRTGEPVLLLLLVLLDADDKSVGSKFAEGGALESCGICGVA